MSTASVLWWGMVQVAGAWGSVALLWHWWQLAVAVSHGIDLCVAIIDFNL